MRGLLGALSHPNPRRALVIGLGTGSTAGWLGAVPSIERVDVVELEPLILEVARACAPVNHDVLNNPKVHITIGDARETLLTTRDRYDVIASEPSNPYRAGIASLFTQEYYRAAADRLTDDGVFVQWVQAYEIDTPTLRTIYATLASVFPQVETWHTNPGRPRAGGLQTATHVSGERPRAADRRRAVQVGARQRVARGRHPRAARALHRQRRRWRAGSPNAPASSSTPTIATSSSSGWRDRSGSRWRRSPISGMRRARPARRGPRSTMSDAVQWPAVDTAWLSYNASRWDRSWIRERSGTARPSRRGRPR